MEDFQAKLLEEKNLRAVRARRRFKAAVRSVMNNIPWLLQDGAIDLANVRRNVTALTRRKKSAKGLTIKEKALLRKNAEYRTEEEKRHLHKFIGDIQCFKPYPADVKYALVGVTYFEFFEGGRIIMQQGHPPQAMYFILSGLVSITQQMWDEVENKWVTNEIGKMKAGRMFGEVSLLHNTVRTATITTVGSCEFLSLRKADFDNVLKDTIQKLWDEIQDSMSVFPYFDHLDDIARRECCLISKIKKFDTNQTIFGDGVGQSKSKMAYFIIDGQCSVIETLMVHEQVRRGIKYYKLYDPSEGKSSVSIDPIKLTGCYANANASMESIKSDEEDDKGCQDTAGEEQEKTGMSANLFHVDEEKKTSITIGGNRDTISGKKIKISLRDSSITKKGNSQASVGKLVGILKSFENVETESDPSEKSESHSQSSSKKSNDELDPVAVKRKATFVERRKTKLDSVSLYTNPPEVKVHFIQVCILNERSCFKDGPFMKNRRIVGLTKVKILLIPSFWLLSHNKGNIWARIENYVSFRMPTTKTVFMAFVKQRRWLEYRRMLREDILATHKFPNSTTIHDVPYSIRISQPIE